MIRKAGYLFNVPKDMTSLKKAGDLHRNLVLIPFEQTPLQTTVFS